MVIGLGGGNLLLGMEMFGFDEWNGCYLRKIVLFVRNGGWNNRAVRVGG